jgi:GT2 family glycosyltransferase
MVIDISVIIVNWNGKEVIGDCLASIYSSNYDMNKVQIIVVDNNSNDNSIEIIEKYPIAKLIKECKNVGFAEGNNIGYKFCTGKYIAMINNDLVIGKEWLNECKRALEEPIVGGVCGKIYEWNAQNPKFDRRNKVSTTILKVSHWNGRAINYNYDSPDSYKMDTLSGAAMMVKKSIIDKIGFLDKEYFAYYEETDLCSRITKAGYKLKYVSSAHSWHKVSHSTKKLGHYNEFNLKMMVRNRILFIKKNAGVLQKIVFPFILAYDFLFLWYMADLKFGKFQKERKFYDLQRKYLIGGIKTYIGITTKKHNLENFLP